MAAKSKNEIVPNDVWTRLTDTASAATIDNLGNHPLIIQATTTAVAPADGTADGIKLLPGQGVKSSDTFAVLFPGVTTPTEIYALSRSISGEAFVSHA